MEARARLQGIFTTGGGDASNDALRYSAPKEPTKAGAAPAAAAAPSSGSEAPTIIFSAAVQLHKYDLIKKEYAASYPNVGCVILGSNATYSVLFYKTQKEQISLSPVTTTFRATLQANGYVNLYDAVGDNYSARFASETDAQSFIRTLFLTKIHVGIWGQGQFGAIAADALTKEELSAIDGRVIADGDTVGVAFSVWRIVGNAGCSPLDVVTKYPPFEKAASTNDMRKFRIGDKAERIAALEEGTTGMKKGGSRILLAPPAKTNGKDWYILQIEVLKIKSERGDEAPPRRRATTPSTPAPAADPTPTPTSAPPARDLVPYADDASAALETQRQALKDMEAKIAELKKEAAQSASGMPSNGSPYAMPPSMYASPYMPPPPAGYPWAMAPPVATGGKPLDLMLMELHTKVDHLIRIAPNANTSSSSLLGLNDATSTLRGVERLVGENDRLLSQLNLQNQQFQSYESKYDEAQRAVAKLSAEKVQWKDQLALQQAEAANLAAARDAALTQASRLHQEVQQLRYAFYQKQQSTSDSEMREQELTFEKDARMRAETALKHETMARSMLEQEVGLLKKQTANLTSLHESEIHSLKLSLDRAVAQAAETHKQEIDALYASFEADKATWSAPPGNDDLQAAYDELRSNHDALQADVARLKTANSAHAAEVANLEAEKSLRMQRIAELEELQTFTASAREQEVRALTDQVQALEAQLRDLPGGPLPEGACATCASTDARLAAAAAKEDAAATALEEAEAVRREAQELLTSSGPPSSSQNVGELFKEVVNDIFFRFQDVFEDEVSLDGNQVLKDIKKILKQSTKEVLAKMETSE
ncbi:hypothetical protein SPRG_13178 [Saprolegnia parasitica CBS 223.65]|uniref:PPIase FKBP-type domain-containing protein n=1 Tax=Saprolegnia parasitica (strain CBS 223.65) TaxID=695850 RepID=A0A067BTE0_SAPPC|nr:hypothetical protein SPRG_13178 [Saprolegnia parasitica CBS 223.65]KDO21764.1 hypothetical protein SPRG_13178 [Saprolegnia parasitica CBS 223.65]|eukprot:XP_012207564.1 hypothetical protein SPRG_13178 [Saprolegnia parasitica CBS 223.65]